MHAPIAVVGVSALFPGSVDKTGFWRDILAGKDLITEVPPSHWLIKDYYDPDPTVPDKTYAKRGGFLPPVDFDPVGWGVPPSTVPATDTAQLLALIVAQQVLDDASQGQFANMDREKMSVILGVTSAQELLGSMVSRLQHPIWRKSLREAGLPEERVEEIVLRIRSHYADWQEATFPGLLGNVVAGRIANRLDLHGTNCVTDAACASTLSALNMGMNELRLGQSDVVLCGGVDTMNDIFMYMCFSKTPAMSPTGDCRPFSDQADGTMLGEGLCMLALRRLDDAERDGDRIYAVIRGIGSSSDGRAKSVYAPVAEGQSRALRRAFDDCGYGADSVELVEAHGTGTKAGDAAEFEGLSEVFDASGREDRQWCAIGSVKSQIGHAKAAAGAAGLFKAIMALHHKVLPPTIKVERPNPKLELEKSPFYLNTETRPWVRDPHHPRRAGVSSFGFGGSNFHVALEEYTGPGKRAWRLRTAPSELVVLAGSDATALRKAITVTKAAQGSLARIARTSQETLDASQPARLAVVASDLADLQAKLGRADQSLAARPSEAFSTPDGVHYALGGQAGAVGFLFPGQGSQYLGMGADVAMAWDAARSAWDDAAHRKFGGESLHHVVFPRPVFDEAQRAAQDKALTDTRLAQPALGVASLALLRVLDQVGVRADAAAGHSYGEVAALHAAGVLDTEAFLRASAERGKAMHEASAIPGSMVAVQADIEAVRRHVAEWKLDVAVANHNAPDQVVLSGTKEGVADAEKRFTAAGILATRLNVATAFHSPIVAPAAEPLAEHLADLRVTAPRFAVYADATAAPYPAEPDAIRALLAEQLSAPVRFVEIVEAMYARGIRTFVEVGPNAVLTRLVGKILDGKAHVAVALDRKGKNGVTALHEGLGRLVVAGVKVDLAALWRDYAVEADAPAKPKLVIPISGANYGKPYPAAAGSPFTPKAIPAAVVAATSAPIPAAASPAKALPAAPSPAPAAPQPVAQVAGPVAAPAPAPRPAATSAAPAPAPASGAWSAWVAAYQETQRQTAEAHAAYQTAMADSHGAFLRTVEASFSGLSSMMTGQPMAAMPAPAARAPIAAPISAPAPLPAPMPAPVQAQAPAAARMQAPAPVAPPAPIAKAVAPAPAPVAAPTPKPGLDLEGLLLGVVAEKTGYPTDLLGLQMELEADLGIDSIKRVEILSAVRERAPELPEVDAQAMAALNTLGAILDHLRASAPEVFATGNAASGTGTGTVSKPGVNLEALLLGVVSEKTGYPTDLLGLQMELEADLGIDSIKRVEILSAVREKAPELPEVDAQAMAALNTLGAILEHLRASAPEVFAGSSAASGTGTGTGTGTGPKGTASGVNLEALLLGVVSEKTGYPTDLLGLQMELEADLGIDSIKRVEILSAVREKAPELPEVDAQAMAALNTLGAILDHLRASAPEVFASAPAPSPSPAAAAPGVDLEALLLGVVAEKTGYPTELLGLQMELEADLGIDSIKRVEILSAVREKAPELPEVDAQAMAALNTLGAILEHLRTSAPGVFAGGNAASGTGTGTGTGTHSQVGRFVQRAVPAIAPGLALHGLGAVRRLAITDDGTGVAPVLATLLRGHGVPAEVVATLPADADGVVLLDGLRAVADRDAAIGAARAAFAGVLAAAPTLSKGGVLVTVQDTGGHLGTGPVDPIRAWLGGLPGLLRTAALEWTGLAAKAIDVEVAHRGPAEVAAAIATEMLGGGSDREVGLPASGPRLVLRTDEAEPVVGSGAQLGSSDVIVVSGGARGVTAACAVALANATKARLVLLGRTAPIAEAADTRGIDDDAGLKKALIGAAKAQGRTPSPAEIGAAVKALRANREVEATLAAIRAAGSDVRYVAADVTDAKALAAGLDAVRAAWGPVTGFVHGAGVLADKALADKTLDHLDRVLAPKLGGLAALLDATSADPLKLIVLFSSVAGRTGNVGQADYALANRTLDTVAAAERARRPGCRVASIAWGPWEGGMVTKELAAHFGKMGVTLIPLAEGARRLVAEATGGSDDVSAIVGGAPGEGPLGAEADHAVIADVLVGPASYPWLADHTIASIPVVPVVLALEWFARAASAARPDLVLGAIRDLKVLRGIQLKGWSTGGDRFVVKARQISNGDGAVVALELLGADGKAHYTAQADLVRRLGAAGDPLPLAVGAPLDGEIYDGHTLFHGPALHAIVGTPKVGDGGSSGLLVGGRQLGWTGDAWKTDPVILDGALQLAVLFARHVLGGATLPTRIDAFRLHRLDAGLQTGPLHARVVVRERHAARVVTDIVVMPEGGPVLFELRGVETHLRPGEPTKRTTVQPEA